MKLYPRHQHDWAERLDMNRSTAPGQTSTLVTCTVCGFQAPRNAAGLDGVLPPKTVPVTDKGVAT